MDNEILDSYDFGPPGPLGKCKMVDGEAREEIKKMIVATARKYGIPPEVFLAQMLHESGETLNPRIEGDAGIYGPDYVSFGIGQVNTVAHPDYDVHRALGIGKYEKPDVEYELEYSARFLSHLKQIYGTIFDALYHYNGSGPQAEEYAKFIMNRARELKEAGQVPE